MPEENDMRFGQLNHRVFFEGDNGGGAGGAAVDGGKPASAKPDGDGVTPEPKTYTEDEVKGLKSALEAEREARKAAEKGKADRERERKAAEEKSLEEQKKFQELADARKAKLDEIEPQILTATQERDALKVQADSQAAVLKEFLDAEVKALKLDDATRELLTGKTEVEQLRWIAKHRETLAKGRASGAPGTPKPDGTGSLTDEEKRKQAVKIW